MSSEGQSEENPKKKMRSKREKYAKVSLKTKIIFFQKVVHEQGDLREVVYRLDRFPKNLALSTPPPRP